MLKKQFKGRVGWTDVLWIAMLVFAGSGWLDYATGNFKGYVIPNIIASLLIAVIIIASVNFLGRNKDE